MLVAISGGIGSGKSVVAHILMSIGFQVYDCDKNARFLIDNNNAIKHKISNIIGQCSTTDDGMLNRKLVGNIVFNNPEKLEALNKLTHSAVRDDIKKWQLANADKIMFVETAILYQSNIDKMVDAVIEVVAPLDIRIKRVQKRNKLNSEEVISRINAQNFLVHKHHARTFTIINDGNMAILPQLGPILKELPLE